MDTYIFGERLQKKEREEIIFGINEMFPIKIKLQQSLC
jgi:hypothetical protein